MIRYDMPQNSDEWFAVKLGIPSAGSFEKIVTPTGKLSAQSRAYAISLVTETILRRPLISMQGLEWIERGKELEPQAARMYEFETETETELVGFITTDDGRWGASPDRLIKGVNGAVEIKCPAPQTHFGYMLDGFGKDYVPQVQGQMLVGGFDFVDRYSFHPECPPYRERTYRDEDYIAKLRDALTAFCEMRDELLEKARAMGVFAERAAIALPADQMEEG